MTFNELDQLAQRENYPLTLLKEINEKYPSAKKELVEQVLQYVRSHGIGYSYAFFIMEMDQDLLSFFGIYDKARQN
jgi:hypothetical protein